MDKLDRYNIKQEIGFIYITKDGNKFVDIDDAVDYIKGRNSYSFFDRIKASIYSFAALVILLSLTHYMVKMGALN